MDGDVKKTAILVAGMHRSGTSAISRILNLLGCALPKTMDTAGPDNPRGFWESLAIRDLNDRILASAGSAWDDWEPFDPRWYASPVVEEFRDRARATLTEEFGDCRFFVLKDPRICRLLPFWVDSLNGIGATSYIVTPIRNPLDVAMSLEARNGIDRSIGLLLWLRHVLDADAATRHLKRVYLRYERLISEPHAVADEMSDGLGVVWPRRSTDTDIEIDDFLSPALRHHRTDDDSFFVNPRLSTWIRDSFDIFNRWTYSAPLKADQDTLDGIRAAFNVATPAFGRAVAVGVKNTTERDSLRDKLAIEERRTGDLGRRKEDLERRTEDLERRKEHLERHSERLERHSERLTTELKSAREEIANTATALAEHENHIAVQTMELIEREKKINEFSVELTEREKKINELSVESKEREKKINELSVESKEREKKINELSVESKEREKKINEFSVESTEREKKINELSVESKEREKKINEFSVELTEREKKINELSVESKEREKKINEFSVELIESHDRANRLDRQLLELRTSTSWRITGPMRYARTRTTQLIRIMRFLFGILRTPWRAKEFVQRTIIVARNEGYAGLKSRLYRIANYHVPSSGSVELHERSSGEFVVPDATSKPDIFVFSIVDWDFRFQRSQHLAIEFADSGRRVFYLEMMLEPGDRSITRIRDNLYRIRLSSRHIGYLQPYFGQAEDKQKSIWFEEFCAICDAVQATSFKQVIVQHPYWWQFARSLPPEFQLVHDCMDDISGFSNTDDFVLEMESDMVRNCDTLVVSSGTLYEKFKDVRTPMLIRNAANIEHFSNGQSMDTWIFRQNYPSLQMQPKSMPTADCETITIGYVGAIAEWFDAELVRQVAVKEPRYEFHLCGDVSSKSVAAALAGLGNVRMYGEIGYRDVPAFLRRMDVLIIPFKILPIIEACDPVKFYEYCAMGKPTVATPLPELNRVSDLVFLASTPEEFGQEIRNAYDRRGDTDLMSALQAYAGRNTWNQRGRDFLGALEDMPLISVVVLSYGDAELTKVAIQSFFEHGATYPNLEILVVDNGSPRADVENIREFAGRYRNIHIVENGMNLGFAKGNNIGLKRAGGEYVMLLNNDTYVAPGAIHGMARHLARHPEIGAVGPLTNNIGNEARLAVAYENMGEMRRTVRDVTWGYRNRHFAVDSLGYFAVMFRCRDLERFGLLPEEYGLGMFEDDDHSRTIQASGYVTAVAEDAFVHHHLSASFDKWDAGAKQALFDRNKSIFERKWGPWKPHEYRASRPERIL